MVIVLTLVHGTWARNAGWTLDGSILRETFQQSPKDGVVFRAFEWTGKNSFEARQKAGIDLREYLAKGLALYPEATHSVVAHSHGGNIILFALEDPKLRKRIARIVCLSTPFIMLSRRTIKRKGMASQVALVVLLYIALANLLMSFIAFDGWEWPIVSLSIYGILAALYLVGKRGLGAFLERRTSQLLSNQPLSPASDLQLLLIRSTADEASGALGTAQFLAWIIGKVTDLLVRFPGKFYVEPYKINEGRLRKYGDKVGYFARKHHWAMWQLNLFLILIDVIYIIFGVILPFPFSFLWNAFRLVLVLFSSMVVWLLIPLLKVALACLVSPFSPRDLLPLMLLNVSVESAPYGTTQIFQLAPSDTSTFRHSTTYEDPSALSAAKVWIGL